MKDYVWLGWDSLESVMIGLELSQLEWAGKGTPKDRVTSFSDSS